MAAIGAARALTATVHLSFGDVPGEERLPEDLVDAAAGWFAEREGAYRGAGLVGDRIPGADGADPQTRLLAAFGRDGRVASALGGTP